LQNYLDKAKIKATFKETVIARNEAISSSNTNSDNPQDSEAAPSPSGRIVNEQFGVGLYYFHPDHLGTTTFLTDANGDAYQFFLNLPFGETMAEQKSWTQNYATPYKFTGKELDDETGMYYFGARYYSPRESIWLSTDVLMEDYPNISPYNYCANNPINIIDPDGRFLFDVHRRILTNGVKGIIFNKNILKGMGIGRSDPNGGIVYPDLTGTLLNPCSYDNHEHFDSMNSNDIKINFLDIKYKTEAIIELYNSGKLNDNSFGFQIGTVLHTIQDFYSHSNYVELFEQSGGSLNGTIPTYQEVMNGNKYEKFKEMINSGQLNTGTYDEKNHQTGPGSHKKMNKDQGNGSTYTTGILSNKVPDAKGNSPTKYSKAAEKVATRATQQHLQSVKEAIK